jgi:tetratricopeptide (TPR) repeat protein
VKEYDRAKAIYQQVIQYRKDADIELLYNTSEHYKYLGLVNCDMGLLDEAIAAFDQSLLIMKQPKYNYFLGIAVVEMHQAQCWLKFQHVDQAAEIIHRIGPEIREAFEPDFHLVQELNDLETTLKVMQANPL